MFDHELSFEKLEPIEQRIRQLNQDAAYIAVWELQEQKREENLGRLDLEPNDVVAYLERDEGGADEASDDDELELDDPEESDDRRSVLGRSVGGLDIRLPPVARF